MSSTPPVSVLIPRGRCRDHIRETLGSAPLEMYYRYDGTSSVTTTQEARLRRQDCRSCGARIPAWS